MPRLRSTRTLLRTFHDRLTPVERRGVDLLGKLARRRGSDLYLVGGSVRDLLLGRAHLDLDFVVETDAPAVARAFVRALGGHLTVHDAFRTAHVLSDGFEFDLVTARRERYPTPGALPMVEPSALSDDLARRDFAVNAMALVVTGEDAGTFIDPHSGRTDLTEGRLRVLHQRSFQDDATRLWRAGRYGARLRLTLDPATLALIERDRAYLDTISPARIHHELERVLQEPAPERPLRRLDDLGVLRATFARLGCSHADARAFPRLQALAPSHPEAAAVATLGLDWDSDMVERGSVRLGLERHERAALAAMPALRDQLASLVARGASPGAAAPELDRFPEAAVAALAARHPHRRDGRIALAYLTAWRHVRPRLRGDRLREMGLEGPAIGEALRRLQAAALDGLVSSIEDEEELVRRVVEEQTGGGSE